LRGLRGFSFSFIFFILNYLLNIQINLQFSFLKTKKSLTRDATRVSTLSQKKSRFGYFIMNKNYRLVSLIHINKIIKKINNNLF